MGVSRAQGEELDVEMDSILEESLLSGQQKIEVSRLQMSLRYVEEVDDESSVEHEGPTCEQINSFTHHRHSSFVQLS